MINEVDVFFFFVAMSEFDQICYEDYGSNRLKESLDTLNGLIHGNYGKNKVKNYILIFTKFDIFKLKIEKNRNLKKFQNEYKGKDDDVESASDFIQSKFHQILQSNSINFETLVLDSLDSEGVKRFSNLLEHHLNK